MDKRLWANLYSATWTWDIYGISSLTSSVLPLSDSSIYGFDKAKSGHHCLIHRCCIQVLVRLFPSPTYWMHRQYWSVHEEGWMGCFFLHIVVWRDSRMRKCALSTLSVFPVTTTTFCSSISQEFPVVPCSAACSLIGLSLVYHSWQEDALLHVCSVNA